MNGLFVFTSESLKFPVMKFSPRRYHNNLPNGFTPRCIQASRNIFSRDFCYDSFYCSTTIFTDTLHIIPDRVISFIL